MVQGAMAGRSWLKSLAFPIAAAGVFVLACDNPPPPPPQAAVASQIGPGPTPADPGGAPFGCGLNAQDIIAVTNSDCESSNPSGLACIGNPDKAESVATGNDAVTVACTISAAPGGVYVTAKVQVDAGKDAGNITFSGTFKAPDLSMCMPAGTTKGCPTTPQQADTGDLNVTFVRADTGGFDGTSPGCTAWYTNVRSSPGDVKTGPFNPLMGAAPGRLWMTIACPAAAYKGSAMGHTACDSVATIKLENCDPGTTN